MKRNYTILKWKGEGVPEVIRFKRTSDVNAWLEKNCVRMNENDFQAGQCIHKSLDDSFVMIFRSLPLAIKNRVELFSATAITESD